MLETGMWASFYVNYYELRLTLSISPLDCNQTLVVNLALQWKINLEVDSSFRNINIHICNFVTYILSAVLVKDCLLLRE